MPSTGTTATTIYTNEVCIGFIAFDVDTTTDSPTNSFTEVTERVSGAPDLTILERIVSVTGAYGTTVDFTDAAPVPLGSSGVIATFRSPDAIIAISASTASATGPSVTQVHSSSVNLSLSTASGIVPNVNVQAGIQVSISVGNSSANSLALTARGAATAAISVCASTANSTGITENHSSAISLATTFSEWFPIITIMETIDVPVSSATAQAFGPTPTVSTTLNTFTASASMPSLIENHGSTVSISLSTATANSLDAIGITSSGSTRRIIITCS